MEWVAKEISCAGQGTGTPWFKSLWTARAFQAGQPAPSRLPPLKIDVNPHPDIPVGASSESGALTGASSLRLASIGGRVDNGLLVTYYALSQVFRVGPLFPYPRVSYPPLKKKTHLKIFPGRGVEASTHHLLYVSKNVLRRPSGRASNKSRASCLAQINRLLSTTPKTLPQPPPLALNKTFIPLRRLCAGAAHNPVPSTSVLAHKLFSPCDGHVSRLDFIRKLKNFPHGARSSPVALKWLDIFG